MKHDESKTSPTPPVKQLTAEEDETIRKEKAEKRRHKRERQNQKKQAKRERDEAKKALKKVGASDKQIPERTKAKSPKTAERVTDDAESDEDSDVAKSQEGANIVPTNNELVDDEANDSREEDEDQDEGMEVGLEFPKGLATDLLEQRGLPEDDADTSEDGSDPDTPTFDMTERMSSASSSSSIVPPSEPEVQKPAAAVKINVSPSAAEMSQPITNGTASGSKASSKAVVQKALPDLNITSAADKGNPEQTDKFPKLSEADAAKLKERLEARLAAMRAARKADGPDGRPAKNRQDLIEARRQKQEKRKQHKKELRQKAKQDQSAEDEAARLRGGSGSPMWSPNAILSPRETPNNFSFGKVEGVDQGTGPSASKGKGPQDVKTALEAAEKKQKRISGLDQEKRQDIEEKDRWLNAKKRVQGEKLRDNTSLLKKTLKRKDKGKAKSEKEWDDRIQGVQAGKEAKQRRREDNLKKRKEDKGSKKGGGKPAPKPKKRPGFEGNWKLGSKAGKA